jgi:hypothetical protein
VAVELPVGLLAFQAAVVALMAAPARDHVFCHQGTYIARIAMDQTKLRLGARGLGLGSRHDILAVRNGAFTAGYTVLARWLWGLLTRDNDSRLEARYKQRDPPQETRRERDAKMQRVDKGKGATKGEGRASWASHDHQPRNMLSGLGRIFRIVYSI